MCESVYKAPLGHTRDLDLQPVTLFRIAVDALQPGATGSQAATLLGNRVSRNVCCNWLAGRRQAPQWALRALADQHSAIASQHKDLADTLTAQKERPGLKAGALNLAKWRARPKP